MPTDFAIIVSRRVSKAVPGNADPVVIGTVSVNGSTLGASYENDRLKIGLGTYPGLLRYWSGHNFVQGPFGTLGRTGDFLVQIDDVVNEEGTVRTGILFHGGNQPKHSKGCILLGPVRRDALSGTPVLGPEDPLRKMRLAFYGTDTPAATPNKRISVEVREDPVATDGKWRGKYAYSGLSLDAVLTVNGGAGSLRVTVTAGPVDVPVGAFSVSSDGRMSFVFGSQQFAGALNNDLVSVKGDVTTNGDPQGQMTLTLD